MARNSLTGLLHWLDAHIPQGLLRRAAPDDPRLRHLHRNCHALNVKELIDRPIEETRFIVVDTETTGLHAYAGDEIVSICLIELVGLETTGRVYETMVNPGRPIPDAASAVHGIHDHTVKGHPPIEDVIVDIVEFVAAGVVVGHHVNFDLRFMNKAAFKQLRCGLRNPCVDTMLLYLAFTGRLGHYTLEEVARHCAVSIDGRHSARGDATAAAAIFSYLSRELLDPRDPLRQLLAVQRQGGSLM